MTTKETYQQVKIARTLLSAALVLSIFSLSGYVYNYRSKQVQATKTELVVRKHSNFKRSISYKRIIQFAKRNDFSRKSLDQIIFALESLHSSLNTLKLEHASKLFLPQNRVLYQKTIPSNSKSNEYLLS